MSERCLATGAAFSACPNKQTEKPTISNCALNQALQYEDNEGKKRYRNQVSRCTGCPFQGEAMAQIPQ